MKEDNNLIADLQMQSQQMQNVLIQKQTFVVQNKEIEKALEEIEKSEEIYKSIGPILVKTSRDEIRKELQDAKEEIEIKLKALERQENRIKEKLKECQEKIQAMQIGG